MAIDYWAMAGLDWGRVHFPPPAPCAHGGSGAPYCIQCLTPIIEQAIQDQTAERVAAERDQLAAEDAARREDDSGPGSPGQEGAA